MSSHFLQMKQGFCRREEAASALFAYPPGNE